MCGISGIVSEDYREAIYSLNGVLKHRGPDDEGFYFDETAQLAFGHKRLSIIDTTHGHQPFLNEDKSIALIYNGELFNAPTLRKKLESAGYAFRTDHSDTEVVLKMYEAFGIQMVEQFNGMFSFVIHDRKKGALFGARDLFGLKPLHYCLLSNGFAFSSEIKSLLKLQTVDKEIDLEALSHYLSFQCIPAPLSIYRGIKKLPAGHYFEYHIQSNRFTVKKYWAPTFGTARYSENELYELTRSEVEKSVKRWSLSDVEVGCSLSGGLDSSIITLIASTNQINLKTYTLGFDGHADLDERNISRELAKQCGTNHTEVVITERDVLNDLPLMIAALDEPYAGGLPSWFIYKRMGEDIKVCLTGSGGDELFGNYGKWKIYSNWRDYLYTIRKNRHRIGLIDLLKNPQGCFYYKYFTEREKKSLLRTKSHQPSSALVQRLWDSCSPKDPKNSVVTIDTQLQLPEEFLFMTDRFSMNYSIEARTPFLDKELVSFIWSLSPDIRSNNTDPKYLLRKSFEKVLPAQVYNNPKKGFVMPLNAWIWESFKAQIDELFDDAYLEKQQIFKTGIKKELAALEKMEYGTEKMWTLFMFQFWYKCSFSQNE